MTGQEIKKMLNLPELSIDFIPYGTDEWYEYRKTGIGGSEIATIMGANKKYDCAARLYNVKIGRIVDKQQDNEAMYHGRHLEDYIANMWKYYNGRDNYIDNANEGKEQRQCIKVEGFIRNRMYPFLFASVDRLILPGSFELLDYTVLRKPGILEIKTITSDSSRKWKHEIPPYYIFQVHLYMIILDLNYAEIAVFKDGRYLSVYPMYREDKICEAILDEARKFWFNIVTPGQKAYIDAQGWLKKGNLKVYEDRIALVDNYEPPPDGGDAYDDFIHDRFNQVESEVLGKKIDYNRAMFDMKAKEAINQLTEIRNRNIQMIKRDMIREKIGKISFKENGYVKLARRANNVNPTFSNYIKYKPDPSGVEVLVNDLIGELLLYDNEEQ